MQNMVKNALITRNGILNMKGRAVANQCAKQGHEVYRYQLKVLFEANTSLNENGWIIDHQIFDDAIQEVQVNSCEIMSAKILDRIEQVLKENKLECIGIKLKIRPAFVAKENSAYFQEFRCHDRNGLALVLNL